MDIRKIKAREDQDFGTDMPVVRSLVGGFFYGEYKHDLKLN